ncbi:MAG: hypothetical protein ACR5K9_05335 [Wolbachia sp.]
MWKSIKKFFKWIADHTGISWIARKISSCWNSVRNWWSGNKANQANVTTQTEEQPQEPAVQTQKPELEPVISGIHEDEGKLTLFVEKNHVGKVFGNVDLKGNTDLNFTEITDKLKYRVYIKYEKGGIFQITCDKLIEANNNGTFLSIESVASQDGKTSSIELAEMKRMLGINNECATAVITQISKDLITVPKVIANNNTPNSETTEPETQTHTTARRHSI